MMFRHSDFNVVYLLNIFSQDVCNQIWATLYDYPCLRSCDPLVKYIKDSVRLAWALINQVRISSLLRRPLIIVIIIYSYRFLIM